MTIREKYGVLKGLKMCYIGDGNNMANSLIVGGLKSDMQVSIATPDNYRPAKEVLDFAAGNDAFTLVNDPIKAVENADVVITDTRTSMGQEEEKKIRQQAFQGYQIKMCIRDSVRTAYASEIWAQLTKKHLTKSSTERFREYIKNDRRNVI